VEDKIKFNNRSLYEQDILETGRNNLDIKEVSSIDTYTDPSALARCSSEEARNLLDYKQAIKLQVLPIVVLKIANTKVLSLVATENDRDDADLASAIRFATGLKSRITRLPSHCVLQAIEIAYMGSESEFSKSVSALKKQSDHISSAKSSKSEEREYGLGEAPDFVKKLISYAISRKASDIHLIPKVDGLFVTLRIDGSLYTHKDPLCSKTYSKRIVSRIKVLSSIDTSICFLPQDGSFNFELSEQNLRIRVSIMPTLHGEKVVLRLFNTGGIIRIEDLGFNNQVQGFIKNAIHQAQGLILVAGATGSGKTTTLYSIVSAISEISKNVVTIEDPIEQNLAFASQTEVNEKLGLNYAKCLRAMLRQDPDCMLIGELRDDESALVALQASTTGHLVLSSVHAGSIADIFLRLEALGIKKHLLLETASLLICQRLLPRLCDSCKVIDLIQSNILKYSVYKPIGCIKCHYSGYYGRVLVYEALELSFNNRILLKKNTDFEVAKRHSEFISSYSGFEDTMKTLLHNGHICYSNCSFTNK
jgi:type II secretory ATPase GspE/PulE/Tfp pilus assembly ATPase PilB-like protein